ncbi:Rv1733c family protein [Mycobacterium asiaticum]|uniref:Rv1733c family protein n=1 Tax=Mycobacterium asiaticum TaxID=1790 RepID=UPI0009BFAC32|nr:hypothetical protein [Mycobacterium asiaticum]
MHTLRSERGQRIVARIRHHARIADGTEMLTAIWIAITLLVGLPLAGVVGLSVYESRTRVLGEQAQTRQLVTAVVVSGSRQEMSDPRTVAVPARWFAGGIQHAGDVTAPRGVKAGDSVDIWADQDGNHVALPSRTPLDEAAAAALSTWLSVSAVAAIFLAGNWAVVQRLRDGRREGPVIANRRLSYGGV